MELPSLQALLVQLIEAFGLGLLSSFTPCVFPLVPITIAIFAGKNHSPLSGFAHGLSYLLGIALTYTILGILSAKAGIIFGSFLGNAWVSSALSLFLLIMAAHTLEIFELTFLSYFQTKASKVGGKGFPGAFLMGGVSGLIAAPCIGPALVLVLGMAAKSQNTLTGALLLFSYSIGLGLIFLLLATFSNLAGKLPKSGSWLRGTKFVLAVLILVVMIFLNQRFLSPLSDAIDIYKHGLLMLIIYSIAVLAAFRSYTSDKRVLRLVAAVIAAFCIFQFAFPTAPSAMQPAAASQVWLSDYDKILATGNKNGQIQMIDLYADWCAACKEYEHITFKDDQVLTALQNLVTGKIDFTDTESPVAQRLTEKYEVPGLPLILFLKADGSGEEIPGSRITGFLRPDEFLDHLRKVKENS